MKKIVITSIVLALLFTITGGIKVSATDDLQNDRLVSNGLPSDADLDTFLGDLEMPIDVIENLSYEAKLTMYNTLDTDSVYEGFTEEDVYLPNENTGGISAFTIPKSQLTLKVSSFKEKDGTYSIYPSFIWKQKARLKNDTFGFALDANNWTTVAGDVGLNMHMVNGAINGKTEYFYYDRPTSSNFAGHAFKFPKTHGKVNHLPYEGHAHFKAKPKGKKVDKRIILKYGDDTSGALSNASYGVSIGVFSISFNNAKKNFRETAQTLSW